MSKITVYNQKGKQVEKLDLDPVVFDGEVNTSVLYQSVQMYRSGARKGLATTKTRGEVSGGGRKPWRQKGTGRARVGSIRSPLWRKGGTIFGPLKRDFSFKIPKKIKLLALKSSLNAKLEEENLIVVDELKIEVPKTKEAVNILSGLKLNGKKILLMTERIDKNLDLSFRNIAAFNISRAGDVNAYDVLRARKLIITVKALEILVNRIKKEISLKK